MKKIKVGKDPSTCKVKTGLQAWQKKLSCYGYHKSVVVSANETIRHVQ